MPIERPPVSRYEAVAADLRRRIADGEWAPGERIPSHRALRDDEYKVSDSVIHAARQLLIAEGVLESRGGAGVYVRRSVERRRVLRSDGPAVALRGQHDDTQPADWEKRSQSVHAPRDIAPLLGIADGDPVMETIYQCS